MSTDMGGIIERGLSRTVGEYVQTTPRRPDICFVGQGPNQVAWSRARERHSSEWAERECARLAITGSVGQRIADMLGMDRLDFCTSFWRFNLNRQWNGKAGKGDRFEAAEGIAAARCLLDRFDLKRYVLLGANVTACFAQALRVPVRSGPLDTWLAIRPKLGVKWILNLPHTSGINRFYNEPANVAMAASQLRKFLGL